MRSICHHFGGYHVKNFVERTATFPKFANRGLRRCLLGLRGYSYGTTMIFFLYLHQSFILLITLVHPFLATNWELFWIYCTTTISCKESNNSYISPPVDEETSVIGRCDFCHASINADKLQNQSSGDRRHNASWEHHTTSCPFKTYEMFECHF